MLAMLCRCSHKVHFGLALTDPNSEVPAEDSLASHLTSIADSLELDSYGVSISASSFSLALQIAKLLLHAGK